MIGKEDAKALQSASSTIKLRMKLTSLILLPLTLLSFTSAQESPERLARLSAIRESAFQAVASSANVRSLNLQAMSLDRQKIELSRAQIRFLKSELQRPGNFDAQGEAGEAARLRISSTVTCFLRNIFEITKEAPLKCAPKGTPVVANKRFVTDATVLKIRDITTRLVENDLKRIRDLLMQRRSKDFQAVNQQVAAVLDKALDDVQRIVVLIQRGKKNKK